MRTFDFKGLIVKNNCLVCGSKLIFHEGLRLSCQKKHFNGLSMAFGVDSNSKVEYVYFYLKDTKALKHYFFFSFVMETMFLAEYKTIKKENLVIETIPSSFSADIIVNKFLDFPLLDLDLSNIPGKGYEDYLKTFSVFS